MCIYTAYYMIVILFSYTTIQLKYIHKQQQQLLLLQNHQQIAATSTRTTKQTTTTSAAAQTHRFMYQKCNKYEIILKTKTTTIYYRSTTEYTTNQRIAKTIKNSEVFLYIKQKIFNQRKGFAASSQSIYPSIHIMVIIMIR